MDEAVPALLRAWGRTDAGEETCYTLAPLRLACERGVGRWSDLRLLDRPAALKLNLDGTEGYVVLAGLDDEYALVGQGDTPHRVPIAVLDERWSGDFLLLWRPPPVGTNVIGDGSSAEAVRWLRRRLARTPGRPTDGEPPDIEPSAAEPLDIERGRYDRKLMEAVRRFQSDHGLVADGIAGPRTLILLGNALAVDDVPRLVAAH
jgi:general secretion pathway protein A